MYEGHDVAAVDEAGFDRQFVASLVPYRLPGKVVHHACGYPLLTEPWYTPFFSDGTTQMPPGAKVIVNYRSALAGASEVIVFCCPGCGRPLKLWWEAPS